MLTPPLAKLKGGGGARQDLLAVLKHTSALRLDPVFVILLSHRAARDRMNAITTSAMQKAPRLALTSIVDMGILHGAEFDLLAIRGVTRGSNPMAGMSGTVQWAAVPGGQ